MRLDRQRGMARQRLITLVPLVDAMLILLVFFMVTSTFLDLDMLPLSDGGAAAGGGAGEALTGSPLLVRLTADGQAVLRGQSHADPAALTATLEQALSDRPGAEVLILPSPAAPVQALVGAMEAATRAGAGAVRILRVEDGG